MRTGKARRWDAGLSVVCLLAVAASGVGACGARTGIDYSETVGLGAEKPAGGTANGGAGALPPPNHDCQSIGVDIANLRPTVQLLVDQSGSMASAYPDRNSPQTRWSLVRQALFGVQGGVVKQFEHSVRFGVTFFTSHNGFSGGVCPLLNEVSAAIDNFQALSGLYDRLEPDDDTPTGAALQNVVDRLQALPRGGPQSILLVTDGDADTCEIPDPQGGQPDALAAAQRAFAAGIELTVLGISHDIGQQNLQQLANAGRGRALDAVWGVDPGAAQPFDASDSVQGLTAQLADILQRSLCTVALQRETNVVEARAGQVLLDGQALEYGASDGFTIADSHHLTITGKACETLTAKGRRLSVRIGCDQER
jgi:hypothetical protein